MTLSPEQIKGWPSSVEGAFVTYKTKVLRRVVIFRTAKAILLLAARVLEHLDCNGEA